MTNKQIAVACVVLILISVYVGVSTYPTQERIGRQSIASSDQKRGDNTRRDSGIDFETLENRSSDKRKVANNIFGPLFPLTKPKVVKKKLPPVVKRPTPPPPTPPTPTDEEIVRQELAQFTFLGLVKKKGLYKVFLSQADDIFVVGAADRFGPVDKFLVVDLSVSELVVRQGDDPRMITIPLVESQKLQATFE